MRMWMTDPRLMCTKHLLGEHLEIHMFLGSIKKNIKLDGYIKKGLVDVNMLIPRHDELVAEMTRRGYRHKSIITLYEREVSYKYAVKNNVESNIDIIANEIELGERCIKCRNMKLPDNKKIDFNYTYRLRTNYKCGNYCNMYLSWYDNNDEEFAYIDFTKNKYLQDGTSDIYAEYCIVFFNISNKYQNYNFTEIMIHTFIDEISKIDNDATRKYIYATGYTKQGEKTVKPLLEKIIKNNENFTMYPLQKTTYTMSKDGMFSRM